MRSEAKTVDAYLASLPSDRRATISAVRDAVKKAVPKGFVEGMNWGMIVYELPLETYPDTYNGQPLGIAAIASQKRYCSLYLNCVYQDRASLAALRNAFADAGQKPDMGKCCIRFQKADELPLKVIGKLLAATPPKVFIREYEAARASAAAQRRDGKNPCE